MKIKVERGIPMPPPNQGVRKYPWDELKVGESFIVKPGVNPRSLCIQAEMKRSPKKFQSRMLKGVTRVWRIA